MAQPGYGMRSLRALAVPLSLSAGVHGLLFAALWLWPGPAGRDGPAALDTRVALELCLLEPAPPTGVPDGAGRADAGDEVHVEPGFQPVLRDAPPATAEVTPSPVGASEPGGPDAGTPPAAAGPGGQGSPRGGGGLFPLPASAGSVVYVIDRSVSMGPDGKLDIACRELLASLRRLRASARFQVITYNLWAEPLPVNGEVGLLPADPAVIEAAARSLAGLDARGGTNHANALRRALALHPAVLFFVTDADDLPLDDVQTLTSFNQRQPTPTAIHAVELTRRRNPTPDGPLARLAHGNGGTYRRVPIE